MSLPSCALVGAQEPRVSTGPAFVSSAGDEAVQLAAMAGLELDPWQQLCLRVMLGERPDGGWAAYEVGLLVARQNGKGAILEARELWGLFLGGEKHLLHSAHEFKTAKEHYRRMRGLIEGCPALLARVKRRGSQVVGFRQSNEDTSIELESGARLRFLARSRSTGRGFSAQVLVVDEAQILSGDAMDSLLPTQSAQVNPQIIYAGTVPGPGDVGEHFTSLRDRGRAGDDLQLAWLEWSADPASEPVLDERGVWAAANPGLGFRISEEFTARERRALSDDGFLRERLSWWPSRESSLPVPLHVWDELGVRPDDRPSTVALAVEVSADRKWSTVYLAGVVADGVWVQVVESRRGVGWVAARVAELVAKYEPVGVGVRAGSNGFSLKSALETEKVPVAVLSVTDMAGGCGRVLGLVDERRLFHDGSELLRRSVGAVRLRPVGESSLWHPSRDGVDVSPLMGATSAVVMLERGDRKPEKVRRSGVVVGVR